jgi:hypothetical protein
MSNDGDRTFEKLNIGCPHFLVLCFSSPHMTHCNKHQKNIASCIARIVHLFSRVTIFENEKLIWF